MTNKTTDYVGLISQKNKEEVRVKNSDEYLDIQDEKDAIQADYDRKMLIYTKQEDALLLPLQKLIEGIAEKEKDFTYNGGYDPSVICPIWKAKNKINALKLKDVIDDEDAFMSLVNITEKSVKDYAKIVPGLNKPLLACKEEVSRSIIGFKVLE